MVIYGFRLKMKINDIYCKSNGKWEAAIRIFFKINGTWQPSPIEDITESCLIEAPYRDAIVNNLNLPYTTSSYLFALAKEPNTSCLNFDLLTRIKGTSLFNNVRKGCIWCPMAKVLKAIGYKDTVIYIEKGYLLTRVKEGTAAIIDNEIVRIDKIDLEHNQLIVGRGCADTVPSLHDEGVRIWFYEGSTAIDSNEYGAGSTVEVKLLPHTASKTLPEEQASIETLILTGRQACPYPPGNLKINGQAYPEQIKAGDITISWSHRNRLLQADQLIDTSVGDISSESSTSYNLSIDNGEVLIKKVTGITTTRYVFNTSDLGDILPKDKSLLQFDDFSDPAGNIWIMQGNPQIIANSQVIGGNWAYFDGNSSLKTFSSTVSNFGLGDFTIECWLKPDSSVNGKNFSIYSSPIIAQENSFLTLGINQFGQPYLQIYNPLTGLDVASGMSRDKNYYNFFDGKSHHLAITRKSGQLYWFYDGLNMGWSNTVDWSKYNITSAICSFIGKRSDAIDGYKYAGFLDQFRITSKALYTNDFTPLKEPYVFNNGKQLICRVILNSQRDGLTSYQSHRFTVEIV